MLGLDLDKKFPNNHITTVIAQHRNKHQNDYISKFVFGHPLVNITCSKWQPISEHYLQQMATNTESKQIYKFERI